MSPRLPRTLFWRSGTSTAFTVLLLLLGLFTPHWASGSRSASLKLLRHTEKVDAALDCRHHGRMHLCKVQNAAYKGGMVKGTRWEVGMALPFSWTSPGSESAAPDLLRLPGPCTIPNSPAWGCPSNIIHLQQLTGQEMSDLCAGAKHYEHPVILVYRNYVNFMHWLSDQLIPYFFALEEFGLSNSTVQIIALDEGAYHIQTPKNLADRDEVWREISGTAVIDWADHVQETFCAPVAVLGDAGHVLRNYNVEMPLSKVLKDRVRYQKLGPWLLSKYNLTHPPAMRDTKNPVIHLIDRSTEGTRRIMNQMDLVLTAKVMTQHAAAVKLEQLPFREQLELLANTDILMGVHGAGLAMAALLPPWGVMVEIKPYAYGTVNRDFYLGMCSWCRLHGIQYMGWHNRARSRTIQAGNDPMYFKNFHTRIDQGNMSWLIQSAIELSKLEPQHRKVNECTQLNEPIMPEN